MNTREELGLEVKDTAQNVQEVITYRGDSRLPEVVFEKGCEARNPSAPHYDDLNLPNPQSRICFSKNIDAAALFPLQSVKGVEDTWIYISRIPLSDDYDDFHEKLHQRAVEDVEHWDRHLGLTFSEEANVREIKPSQIIGAMKCRRIIFGENHNFDGGIYKLVEYAPNPNFKNPDEAVQKIIQENKDKMHKWQSMPTFPNRMTLLRPETIVEIYRQLEQRSKLRDFFMIFEILRNSSAENKKREESEIRRLTALESVSLPPEQKEDFNVKNKQSNVAVVENYKARFFHAARQKNLLTKAMKPSAIASGQKRLMF